LAPTAKKLAEEIKMLGTTLGEELIKPTRLYVKTILDLKEKFEIKELPILQAEDSLKTYRECCLKVWESK